MDLDRILTGGSFGEIDIHFARFFLRLSDKSDPEAALAAAMVSAATGRGDVCLELSRLSGQCGENCDFVPEGGCLPDLSRWRRALLNHPAVGEPGQTMPLILDPKNRLYLYRYWRYEQVVIQALQERTRRIPFVPASVQRTKEALLRHFPDAARGGLEGQSLAAATALLRSFCIISGGPGTGKTFLAARLLALLAELSEGPVPRFFLCAPTGKAAARLGESIDRARKGLDCPETVRSVIPSETRTLHRLLGLNPASPMLRYHRRPLAADVVLVDEASMVDLSLMAKLLEAIPDPCRLILLGDRNQLASVEAGSVLGDLCGNVPGCSPKWGQTLHSATGIRLAESCRGSDRSPEIGDNVVRLDRNYRFAEDSPIAKFSRLVNRGDGWGAMDLVRDSSCEDPVFWVNGKDSKFENDFLEKIIIDGYSDLLQAPTPQKALELVDRFKILCAVNHGPFGVEALNRLAFRVLTARGLIPGSSGAWYPGRPILITRNDYSLDLFNGDLGIAMPMNGDGELMVHFRGSGGDIRNVWPFRLMEYETAFAMTIHKSQGSEFEEVLLVLPDRDSPVLTRELIYTGVTRARHRVVLFARDPILAGAVSRRIDRSSGLREALWESL